MKAVLSFVRREAVAVHRAGMRRGVLLFVPPSAEYLSYIDARVLALLFCLIAAVAGFQSGVDAQALFRPARPCKRRKASGALLSLSCFFSCHVCDQ